MRNALARFIDWHLELFWPDDPDAYPHWAARLSDWLRYGNLHET